MELISLGKVGIGALTLALLVSFGFIVADTDTHFCRDLELAMECDRLSSTGHTCYPTFGTRKGSKYCSSGWEEIIKAVDEIVPSGVAPGSKQWLCSHDGCKAK